MIFRVRVRNCNVCEVMCESPQKIEVPYQDVRVCVCVTSLCVCVIADHCRLPSDCIF